MVDLIFCKSLSLLLFGKKVYFIRSVTEIPSLFQEEEEAIDDATTCLVLQGMENENKPTS